MQSLHGDALWLLSSLLSNTWRTTIGYRHKQSRHRFAQLSVPHTQFGACWASSPTTQE